MLDVIVHVQFTQYSWGNAINQFPGIVDARAHNTHTSHSNVPIYRATFLRWTSTFIISQVPIPIIKKKPPLYECTPMQLFLDREWQ